MTPDLETNLRHALFRDADRAPELPLTWIPNRASETATAGGSTPPKGWLLVAAAVVVLIGVGGMFAVGRSRQGTPATKPVSSTLVDATTLGLAPSDSAVATTVSPSFTPPPPSTAVIVPNGSAVPLGIGPWVAFGDQVMLGAADELTQRGLLVDAVESRTLRDVVDVVDARIGKSGLLGDVIVVAVGANGPVLQGEIDSLMVQLSSMSRVVFVTVRVDRDYAASNNLMIKALPTEYTNVVIVDWELEAANCPGDCFYADGLHLRQDGAEFYSDLIANAIAEDFVQPTIRVGFDEIATLLPQISPTRNSTIDAALLLGQDVDAAIEVANGLSGQARVCLHFHAGIAVYGGCSPDESVGLIVTKTGGDGGDVEDFNLYNGVLALHSSEVTVEALTPHCTITTVETDELGVAISGCYLDDFVGTFDIEFTFDEVTYVTDFFVPDSAEIEQVEVAPIIEVSDLDVEVAP